MPTIQASMQSDGTMMNGKLGGVIDAHTADTIRGLEIRPNPDLGTGSFRIVCAREEGMPGVEETVEAVSDQTVPAELTPLR